METATTTALDTFRQVYADSLGDDRTFEETEKIRSLTWKGERAPLADVAKMYTEIKHGYNEFKPNMLADLLAEFPGGVEATPAREYSATVYLHVHVSIKHEVGSFVLRHFNANEVDWEDDETLRVWWD